MDYTPKSQNQIITLPASIRQKLQLAQSLERQDRDDEAFSLLQQVGNELARTQPELLALLIAGQAGFRQIQATVTETDSYRTHSEEKFLGMTWASTTTATNSTRTVTKTFRLS